MCKILCIVVTVARLPSHLSRVQLKKKVEGGTRASTFVFHDVSRNRIGRWEKKINNNIE